MTIANHARYQQQANWTRELRKYLSAKLFLSSSSRVLEIGCGTGVITGEFHDSNNCAVVGLDNNYPVLSMATRNNRELLFANGDAYDLPFKSGQFDLVFCHYFLLWLKAPHKALVEVMRVLRPGGAFLIFAEPDHLARIDYPPSFEHISYLQTQSLKKQGVNTSVGRQIPQLLTDTGFEQISFGVSSFENHPGEVPDWFNSEWKVLRDDLQGDLSEKELSNYEELDKQSWLSGSRVLWVPTFYSLAIKPD